MGNLTTLTPVQGQYAQEEKPVLLLAHDQRKSIIPIMHVALTKIKRAYGDIIHKECVANWDLATATNESVLKDIFSLFEVRVCDYKESPRI